MAIARVLTVAGSDSGGGAGIQSDLKTFTALGVFGTSVIVALTAQNSTGVLGILAVPKEFVALQIKAVLSDIGTDATKTGMLYSSSIIHTITQLFKEFDVHKLVVDPVMIAKTGAVLLKKEAISTLITELMPIAYLITPNVPEAEVFTETRIKTVTDMEQAAIMLYNRTGANVLVKGGHVLNRYVTDILYDGTKLHQIVRKRINTKNTHGTGDTLSAAIAAYLAKGKSLKNAVSLAREYLHEAIKYSFPMGRGYGVLKHYWRMNEK